MEQDPKADLKKTPLHALHLSLGARMVPFAGYEMPVQFADGIVKEHLQCRAAAVLFDVSHMGQAFAIGPQGPAVLETLMPGNIKDLKPGRIRYTQLLNEQGGILDDLMVTNLEEMEDHLFLVVNAACKDADLAAIGTALADAGGDLRRLDERALLAVQGPAAAAALDRLCPGIGDLKFMAGRWAPVAGNDAYISRCGYTGEDGFEISVAAGQAEALANALLEQPEVAPAGLGARDSLRLEAGLCLYGHDIDTGTTPIEADLGFSIGKRRREEGGFPGAAIVQGQIKDGPPRKRVGIRPEGRTIAREGAEILDAGGAEIGRVTSGGFSPTLQVPIAMGYVNASAAEPGTPVQVRVRGKDHPAAVSAMPFVEQRYYRG